MQLKKQQKLSTLYRIQSIITKSFQSSNKNFSFPLKNETYARHTTLAVNIKH